jgi:hypothetical protein
VQKSTIGGILSIIAGAIGVVAGLILLMVTFMVSSVFADGSIYYGSGMSEEQMITMLSVIYGGMAFLALVGGVLGIVGGIFSVQRKRWGWALTGAIAGCITFLPLGIASVVLVAIGKSEFNKIEPAYPPQPVVNNPV